MSDKIRDEVDPVLREIYAMGYDSAELNHMTQEIILSGRGLEKRIPKRAIQNLNLNFMSGVLPDGRIHSWVKEGDGSCERLRQLIKP